MRFLVLLLALGTANAAAAPGIVTSSAPLNDLTAALTAGISEPVAIIDADASPHHFALRPSHMRKLGQADMVIGIDRHFESGFNRLHQILPPEVRQLELMPHFDPAHADGHFWFSPRLLLTSIDLIVDALKQLDPANAAAYRDNAAGLSSAIRSWREQTRARWQTRPPRVLTDHAFLGALAQEYEFEHVATLHDSHDHGGGLKDLRHLEEDQEHSHFHCLLTLEARPSALAMRFAEKHQLQIIRLDGVSSTTPAKPAILRRLQQLAQVLDACA